MGQESDNLASDANVGVPLADPYAGAKAICRRIDNAPLFIIAQARLSRIIAGAKVRHTRRCIAALGAEPEVFTRLWNHALAFLSPTMFPSEEATS